MKTMTDSQISKHMKAIQERRRTLEDGVNSVCKKFTSALFVWGPGGLGKSHLLRQMLETLADPAYRHHTTYSTPKGLFLSLYEDNTAIHLYEDCEKLLKTEGCAAILRAACGAPGGRERRVDYKSQNEDLSFAFTGGIIIATNENLSRSNGPMQAVASRFRPIKWDMTLEERMAAILTIAQKPFLCNGVNLTVKECTKVAMQLIEMTTASSSRIDLDLRLYTEHALPAFAQSVLDPTMKWEDLMLSKLLGTATTVADTQAERSRKLQQMAQKIDQEGGKSVDKIAKWKGQTGLGQAIYFRHLRAAKGKK